MKKIKYNQEENKRIDAYLSDLENQSRSQIQKLIKSGHIQVNNKCVKPSYLLEKGDLVYLDEPETKLIKTDIDLDIIYEDEDILVIDKSQGLTVHPNAHNRTHTLVNGLLYYTNHLGAMDTDRPGIVHRLDKETSGLIVIAKTDMALEKLMDDFKKSRVIRIYQGICQGHLQSSLVDKAIKRDPKKKVKMVAGQGGREAKTLVDVKSYIGNYTLANFHLLSGRTHQIRVHMESINHPIVGDRIYGNKNDKNKMMLHASSLGINHPRTGIFMEFKTSRPKRFETFLKKAFDKY